MAKITDQLQNPKTITIEEGDRRQETGDRRKITWGFSPQVILNTV
ncbi:hypothetical protein [Okeania sp. SIO1F9]|nr:hypothetical protein [Okeania sp. SIO1F9]